MRSPIDNSITKNRYATFKVTTVGTEAAKVSSEYGYAVLSTLTRLQESTSNAARHFKDSGSYNKAVEVMNQLVEKIGVTLEGKEQNIANQVTPS